MFTLLSLFFLDKVVILKVPSFSYFILQNNKETTYLMKMALANSHHLTVVQDQCL